METANSLAQQATVSILEHRGPSCCPTQSLPAEEPGCLRRRSSCLETFQRSLSCWDESQGEPCLPACQHRALMTQPGGGREAARGLRHPPRLRVPSTEQRCACKGWQWEPVWPRVPHCALCPTVIALCGSMTAEPRVGHTGARCGHACGVCASGQLVCIKPCAVGTFAKEKVTPGLCMSHTNKHW